MKTTETECTHEFTRQTVFHNLCRDYHEITAPPLDCARFWLFAHELFSRHKREDFITTTLNNTWLSFHTGRIDRVAVLPTTLASLAPANCTGSIRVCKSLASANHTSSIRISRSSLDLGYPAWCPSSFHLASPRSILLGLLLLTAVI